MKNNLKNGEPYPPKLYLSTEFGLARSGGPTNNSLFGRAPPSRIFAFRWKNIHYSARQPIKNPPSQDSTCPVV